MYKSSHSRSYSDVRGRHRPLPRHKTYHSIFRSQKTSKLHVHRAASLCVHRRAIFRNVACPATRGISTTTQARRTVWTMKTKKKIWIFEHVHQRWYSFQYTNAGAMTCPHLGMASSAWKTILLENPFSTPALTAISEVRARLSREGRRFSIQVRRQLGLSTPRWKLASGT